MKLLTRPEEFVMLAIWRLQDNAYSLPIREQVSALVGYTWSLSSVYTPLDRLTRKGLVTSRLTASLPERGGRPRRIYTLTAKGRHALLHIRTVEQAMWSGITGLALEG
ncbi:MAG: helix-turn-helix transcriptional regulator [Bacteroidota bacterium]